MTSAPPRWVVRSGPDFMDRAAVDAIAAALEGALAARGEARLAVAGGRTPEAAFKLLAAKPLDWSKVLVTLVDERWVDPADEESNERLVRRALLQGPAAAARFLPMKVGDDPDGAAQRFEAALPADGFDAILLGIGEDGHFASLFPESPALAAGLDPDSRRRCIAIPASNTAPVQPRLSLTLAEIARAGLIVVLAKGEAKRRVVERASDADADPLQLPLAALLRARRDVRVLLST